MSRRLTRDSFPVAFSLLGLLDREEDRTTLFEAANLSRREREYLTMVVNGGLRVTDIALEVEVPHQAASYAVRNALIKIERVAQVVRVASARERELRIYKD